MSDLDTICDALISLRETMSSFSDLPEEATKMACIVPFLSNLGWNCYSPSEVVPEFTADFGTKAGEKVDYALKVKDKVYAIVECKKLNEPLKRTYVSQLFRYFSVTRCKIAVLTNGVRYEFYADTDRANVLDEVPFFVFDINEFTKVDVANVMCLHKDNIVGFDVKEVVRNRDAKRKVVEFFDKQKAEVQYGFALYIQKELGLEQSSISSIKAHIQSALLGYDVQQDVIPQIEDNKNSDTVRSHKKVNVNGVTDKFGLTTDSLGGLLTGSKILGFSIDSSIIQVNLVSDVIGKLVGYVLLNYCSGNVVQFINKIQESGVPDKYFSLDAIDDRYTKEGDIYYYSNLSIKSVISLFIKLCNAFGIDVSDIYFYVMSREDYKSATNQRLSFTDMIALTVR